MSALHINFPRYQYFLVRTKRRGARKWAVYAQHKTEKRARASLARLLREERRHQWHRADLCAWQDWYGLTQLLEVKQ